MSTLGPRLSVSFIEPSDYRTEAPRVLAFIGELDFSLERGVRDVLETVTIPARIDLTQVPFIDARILGEFARVSKRIAPERLLLFGVQPQVRRVMELLKLDRVFVLCDEQCSGPRQVWRSSIG